MDLGVLQLCFAHGLKRNYDWSLTRTGSYKYPQCISRIVAFIRVCGAIYWSYYTKFLSLNPWYVCISVFQYTLMCIMSFCLYSCLALVAYILSLNLRYIFASLLHVINSLLMYWWMSQHQFNYGLIWCKPNKWKSL